MPRNESENRPTTALNQTSGSVQNSVASMAIGKLSINLFPHQQRPAPLADIRARMSPKCHADLDLALTRMPELELLAAVKAGGLVCRHDRLAARDFWGDYLLASISALEVLVILLQWGLQAFAPGQHSPYLHFVPILAVMMGCVILWFYVRPAMLAKQAMRALREATSGG